MNSTSRARSAGKQRPASIRAHRKLAVVGSGLTGLAAARCAVQDGGWEVHLLERAARVGMDMYGVDLPLEDGTQAHLDVPLRVLSPQYYSALFGLYKAAGVPTRAEAYTMSFASLQRRGGTLSEAYFTNRNLRCGSRSTALPSFRSCARVKYTAAFASFLSATAADAGTGKYVDLPLSEWLEKHTELSEQAVRKLILPLLAVVLTCDDADVLQYPAQIVIDYFGCGQGEAVHRAHGGTEKVVEHFTQGVNVRLGVQLQRVIPGDRPVLEFADGHREHFDAVIIATQAHAAARLLPVGELSDLLSSFPYSTTHIVCHYDTRVMPQARRDWRVISFGTAKSAPRSQASVWMNQLIPELRATPADVAAAMAEYRHCAVEHVELPECNSTTPGRMDVFQTLNPAPNTIDSSTVLAECWADRPIMTTSVRSTVERIAQLQGSGNVYVAGSYSLYGMPLLESAVASALAACGALGMEHSLQAQQHTALMEGHLSPTTLVYSARRKGLCTRFVSGIRAQACTVLLVLVLACVAWWAHAMPGKPLELPSSPSLPGVGL